jgi:Trk K+ transport system NAD-binding subunit
LIICGYNELTREMKGIFVDENVPDGYGFIRGDPADAETLKKAGIENEEKMIIATESDEKNIFIALLAKELNPRIRIGAVVKKDENVGKMYRAGGSRCATTTTENLRVRQENPF